MAIGYGVPAPKPKATIKRLKSRAKRQEAAIMRDVRAACVLRDGFCRAAMQGVGACIGRSEWAHLEDHRRSKTRRMNPVLRHTTLGTMMLCTSHHQRYDARTLRITFLSSAGADGEVRFS